MIEEKLIVGKLLVQGEAFDMLDLDPQRHNKLTFLIRESCFEFLVVVNGFAQPIIVGRQSFAIIPYMEPEKKLVSYYVEDEEELSEKKIEERVSLF